MVEVRSRPQGLLKLRNDFRSTGSRSRNWARSVESVEGCWSLVSDHPGGGPVDLVGARAGAVVVDACAGNCERPGMLSGPPPPEPDHVAERLQPAMAGDARADDVARGRDVAHAFPRHLDPQRAAVAYLHRRTEPVTRLRDAGHAPRLLRHRDLGRDGLRDIVGGVDVERLAPCRRCEWGK